MTVCRSIHVSANGTILFLFMIKWYSIVCMYHIFFVHSSVHGHSGCFLVLVPIDSAAVNIEVHVSLKIISVFGLSCSMWDLSSPTRNQTQAPCIGSRES